MICMSELTHHLEVILGPDTGNLAMRFGLHSGPVTAGGKFDQDQTIMPCHSQS